MCSNRNRVLVTSDLLPNISLVVGQPSVNIHSREIKTLHFLFNGNYVGYCLKYMIQSAFVFLGNANEFNKILFRMIINQKQKRIHIRITSVPAHVNVSYFLTFPAFRNVRIDISFRFLQKQMSAMCLITSYFLQMKTFSSK